MTEEEKMSALLADLVRALHKQTNEFMEKCEKAGLSVPEAMACHTAGLFEAMITTELMGRYDPEVRLLKFDDEAFVMRLRAHMGLAIKRFEERVMSDDGEDGSPTIN